MFSDKVRIFIKSGKGGDGHVSFRRELYVPAGGPDGGNGGHGGDIIFQVDKGLNTLGDFRHNSKYIAQSGEEGGKKRCTGKNGEDLIIKVPEGTVIYDDESGKVIADMSGDNMKETILKGGRGGKGNMNYATATMQATLLIFTAKGKCYWLKVFEIPEGAKNSKGRAIQNLLNIEPDDKVNAFIRVKKLTTDTEFINSHYLLFCTKKGVIKKTLLEAYSRPRQNGVNAITLREDDGLIEVCMTNGNNEVLIANRNGRAIRFHENAVRVMGRTASGVRGMTLDDDSNDEVVGMVCIKDKEKETVLVVSEQGYGKRSNIEDYRITNRGGKGVKTINITEKTGKLVAIKNVTEENDIMIINKSGITIRMKVSDLNVIGRATQGVRLINLGKRNDEIASVCKVLSQTEEEIAEEKAQREALEGVVIHEHPIENTDFEDVSDDVESNENADDTEGTTEE